jgi:hypothetical protein
LIAGRNAAALTRGETLRVPPRTTAIGALAYYVSHANPHDYQPTNITFGIISQGTPALGTIRDKVKRKLAISERALSDLGRWVAEDARGAEGAGGARGAEDAEGDVSVVSAFPGPRAVAGRRTLI